MSSFADFQHEIYLMGLADQRPALPTDLTRLAAVARRRLSKTVYGYVAGAAGAESTARANRAAFERLRIMPRMLRDVAERDLRVEVLGTPMPLPIALGPVGALSILHPAGETAVARAAAATGLPMVLSTAASFTMEEVAAANVADGADGPRWYQLYWPKDRELALSLLRRAAAGGYRALVVTLDTFAMAWRPRDLDNAYLPFLRGVGVANYFSDPVFLERLGGPVTDGNRDAAIMQWAGTFGNPSLTWDDLSFLRENWRGPIALKGILHPDDARRAVDHGMDGVIVSNHGGRQVDGSVAALDALPAVVEAVAGRAEVLFDSGIRTGADVAKALALGARAVLIGRLYAYGLGLAGEAGVRHVLRCLAADFELTLMLAGLTGPGMLTPDVLRPADPGL